MVTVSEQYQLECEVKQLKDTEEVREVLLEEKDQTINDLKQKQKKYDMWTEYFDSVTQRYCTVDLETILRQASDYHNLKQKLEQIRDRADIWDGKESGWYGNKLKEILNSKEKE